LNKLFLLSIVSLPLIFTGCALKSNYNSSFQKNNNLEKDYKIAGTIENHMQQGFFRSTIYNRVVLYIDNKLVVKAPLNDDYTGRIELFYKEKALSLECGKDSMFAQPKCIIFLNNENLGKLEFKPDYMR